MAEALGVAGSIVGLVQISATAFTRTCTYARAMFNVLKDIEELTSGIRSLSGILYSLRLLLEEFETSESYESNLRLHHIN